VVKNRRSIKVNEAIERVMKYRVEGSVREVPIEQSYGQFLGSELIADHNVPPFDRSPYDGFAVRSEDTETATRNNPIQFEVIGEIGAGSVFEGVVGEMQAVRIMTGAQIPEGCNAVVMLELANELTIDGRPFFKLKRNLQPGTNISFAGEDTKQGEHTSELQSR